MDDPQAHAEGAPDQGQAYETRDASVRAVIMFGIGLLILIAGVQLLLLAPVARLGARRERPGSEPPPAQLAEQLRRLHATEEDALGNYGPVPGEPEFARVPIDRAMDLVVKQGVPFGKGRKTEVQINTRVKP